MIFKYFFSFTLLSLCLLIGCDGDKQSKIIIHGLLTTNYHPVYDPKDMPDTTYSRTTIVVGGYQKDYIRGAVVKVSSDNQTVQFAGIEQHGSYTYQDTGNHLIITPGKTYSLFVKIPDGRVFESETRVPYDPVILQPVNNDTLILGQDFFEYERNDIGLFCRTPYVYQKDIYTYVELHIKTQFIPPECGFTYIIGRHDSLFAPLYFANPEPQKQQVDLLTLDSSFSKYAWMRTYFMYGFDSLYGEFDYRQQDMPLKYSSNIRGENVVGCFGSYSRTSAVYYLRKP